MISRRPLRAMPMLLVGRLLRSTTAIESFVVLIGSIFGLCTVFALVVTAAEALHEHTQVEWPQTIQRAQR